MAERTITVKVVSKEINKVIVAPMCRQSLRFCQIASTNVLDSDQLVHIQKLGFAIKVLD